MTAKGNGWISIKKRKPDLSKSCLVWFASEYDSPGYIRVHVGETYGSGTIHAYPHYCGDPVTHWMKLPKPPGRKR